MHEVIEEFFDYVSDNSLSLKTMEDDEIENVGIMTGVWDDEEKTKLSVNRLVEKPNKEYAKEQLQIDGKCYGNFGMWIINQYVFNQIESNILNEITSRGEYQFVDAIAQIIDGVGFLHEHGIVHLDLKLDNILLISGSPLYSMSLVSKIVIG